ncbi:MAG: hypothetical protein AMXMBFR16_10760 [Candidatus Uhrbacteria bacterium]
MPTAKLVFSVNNEQYTLEFAELEGNIEITEEIDSPRRGELAPLTRRVKASINLAGPLLETSTVFTGMKMFVNPKGSEVRLIK